jgi:hypothetical protein
MSQLKQQLAARRDETRSQMIDRYIREGRTVSGGSSAATDPYAMNIARRNAVLGNSIEMIQQIFSQNFAAPTAGNNIININPRTVGLIKRFIIEISGTFNNTDGAAASTPTPFGLANLLSNVSFFDLNNVQRVNTTGLHLAVLKQVKHKTTDPASAPVTTAQSDSMIAGQFAAAGAAPNFPVVVYPLPVHAVSAPFRAVFELPLAYSDQDLTGGIYGNVINGQMLLALTLNPNPAQTGTDTTSAVWAGGAGNITNVNVTVYQVFLDQLPVANGQVILPVLDLSTVYELKTTQLTGMTAGNDFPIPYANFRQFLSTLAVFNSTQASAGLKNGVDVTNWALLSANSTNIWRIDPLLAAQRARDIIGSDLPLGTYYFSHRKKPINTTQYGNMQLILNAASVANLPYVNIFWEDFAQQNVLTVAGSLAG